MPLEITGTIDMDAILKRLREKQEKANQANLQRYENLMTHLENLGLQVGEQGTFGAASDLMSQVGEAARTRITEQAQKATAAAEQDLISRGLGATTIRQAERRGIAATAERARQEAEERTAAAKAGVLTQRAGAEMQIGALKAGVMERREDAGPDLSLFASLIQAAAASEKAAAKRTATVIGPQAQAGRDIFGQPMGDGGGGGLAPAGGGGAGGGAAAGGAGGPIGGGLNLGPTGAARAATGGGAGDLGALTAAAGGGGPSAVGMPAGAWDTTSVGAVAAAGGEGTAALEAADLGPGGMGGAGEAVEAGYAEAAEPQREERFETYADYKAAMQRRGMRYPMGPTLWHALNRRGPKAKGPITGGELSAFGTSVQATVGAS